MNNIMAKDFQPCNRWIEDAKTNDNREPLELVDQSTGRSYLYQSKNTLRFKCSMLTLGSPLLQPFIASFNLLFRLFKIISGFHLWIRKDEDEDSSLKGRFKELGWDVLRIAATPLALLALTFSALYGIALPNDGRKLYATCERALYSTAMLAPCFQPEL